MKSPRKLFFLTEYYYPSSNSTSFYLSEIIHQAADVWSGDIQVYCASAAAGPERETAENIDIHRFAGGNMNKNSLFSRVLKFLLLSFKFAMAALCKVRRDDVVFTVTNPAFLLVFLAMLRKLRRFHYILLVYDIFPETLIPAGLAHTDTRKYRLAQAIFNWAYRAVDEFIVIGRDMQHVVALKTGRTDNIRFIPNWSNTAAIAPLPKEQNAILKKYQLLDRRVFALAGNMGRTQGIDNLLEAFRLFGADEHAAFLLMGHGASLPDIQSFTGNHPELPVICTGGIPATLQNDMVNAGDVAMISLAPGMYGLSVPSKTYFNLAAGKPLLLIADETSEVALLIREHQLGWVVPPGNPQALAATLKQIAALPQATISAYSRRAVETAKLYFSEERILPLYRQLFQELSK